MRAVVQRVSHASVRVEGEVVGKIGRGFLVLLGAGRGDTEAEVEWMARKVLGLRVFPDDGGRMNHSLVDIEGELLLVSQFTLYGDCRKGRRPSFERALEPEAATLLCERFVAECRAAGTRVETGVFGAMMDVELLNDGPVTLLIDSERTF
jgi:D-tyrosyl-tRNA(Tyr) deacylase